MTSKKAENGGDQPNSDSIEALRRRIDAIDTELSGLLAERLSLAANVGKLKAKLKISVKDNAREQDILGRVGRASDNTAIAESIKEIYSTIFSYSRQMQVPPSDSQENGSDAKDYFPQITIFGLGLIGTTLARLTREHFATTFIVGVDNNQSVADSSKEQGIVDRVETDAGKAILKSGLIVLAATPNENIRLIGEIAPLAKKRQVIMDVTSVKGPILRAAESLTSQADLVGGHPLFGSERQGAGGANSVRTEGATFCLTPSSKTTELSLLRLIRWLQALGLKAEVVNAEMHDQILARTSHCVQLLAIACGAHLSKLNPPQRSSVKILSGPSFRQLARLMKSPPDMWMEIISQNKGEVVAGLSALESELQLLRKAVDEGDEQALREAFQQANSIAEGL